MQSRCLALVRPLLAALLTLMLFVSSAAHTPLVQAGATRSLSAVATSGKIEIENLDRVPYNDRLVFQRIDSRYSNPTHKTVTLRIKNTDASAPLIVSGLSISGGNNTAFTIPSADAQGFTLTPGTSRDVVVSFVAGRTSTDAGTVKGLRQSTLFVQSSDAATPTLPVQLAGFNMVTDGGVNEPSLQDIVDTFGYTTNILNPGEGQTLRPKTSTDANGVVTNQFGSVGDELYSPRWSQADSNRPVYVRQLAALSGSSSDAATVCVGSTCVTHGPDQFQSFLPFTGVAGNLGSPVELTANPGSSFVIKAGNYGTDRDPARGRAVRLWAARDRSGALIPNTYIVGQDYVGSSATNYDYQDNAYLITNIRPLNQAIDPNKPAPTPGSPSLVLEFDRSYPGTLTDKDGETTGFVDTQRNKNDITAAEQGPTSSYDRSKLDVNTGGQGTLTINTSIGSNTGTDNTLVNGLCTPFDGRSGRFVVSTRLIGPLNSFATAYQQAGVMFGPSQGNFLKLTAGVQVTGSTGKPWIQFTQELNNVSTQLGGLTSIPNVSSIATLDLQLTADAATGKVEAGYRINDGIPVVLSDSVTLTGTARARFFDMQTKGCLLALHKNATEIAVAFDRFAVAPAPAATNLPQVNAGADQRVPLNANVTLTGTATDASGAPLTGSWEQVSGSRSVTLNGSGNSRTFVAPTSYSVLTFAFAATDGQGRSASDTVTVTVGDEPIGGLNITTNSPVEIGTSAKLSASVAAGSAPITYQWDFGDGSAPVTGGPIVKHTYAALGKYTVSLTARNAANTASTQIVVTVQPVVPAFAFRYNIGGPTVTTSGVVWKTDKDLFTPTAPAEKRPTAPTIANTDDDVIYQDYRGKVTTDPKTLTFEFPLNSELGLPADTRVLTDLRLHFAEIYWGGSQGLPNQSGAGKRIFDVFVEGELVLNNFDIAATAGGSDTALVIPLDGVAVTDGKLTVALQAVKDYPSLAAIEILGSPKASPDNSAPTANAGSDQTVSVGTPVTLSGSGSDPDGDALTYSWRQISGPTAVIGGDASAPVRTFTPTSPGSYIFQLTTTDAGGLSGADTVVVTVNDTTLPPNNPPSVNAGADQTALLGIGITLTGSGSDPDGDALTYSWQQTGGPIMTLVGNEGDAVRTFTPTSVGSYIFTLTITDARGLSGADTVVVTITDIAPPENLVPTANASNDQTVETGTTVMLDGTASSDPESGALVYHWQQTSGPAVVLSSDVATQPTFVAPSQPTTLTFQLVVTDNFGATSTGDEVQITVFKKVGGVSIHQLLLPLIAK